jgi:hypothetical protein
MSEEIYLFIEISTNENSLQNLTVRVFAECLTQPIIMCAHLSPNELCSFRLSAERERAFDAN